VSSSIVNETDPEADLLTQSTNRNNHQIMSNANLRLPSTSPPIFQNEIGGIPRSQSQNFTYNALNGGPQVVVGLPTSQSVNDNLAYAGTPTSGSGSSVMVGKDEPLSKSPKSGRVHCIPHKWESRRCKKIYRCVGCAKQIAFMSACQRCIVCKVRAHDNCKSKVGNTCGLTAKHLRACIEYMVTSGTQDDWGRGDDSGSSLHELNDSQRPSSRSELGESSASNSANSSTPSTPAWTSHIRPSNLSGMTMLHPSIAEMAPKTAPLVTTESMSQSESLFTFPESAPKVPSIVLPSTDDNMNEPCPIIDSDHTLRMFGSGDESDQNTLNNESFDSGTTEDSRGHKWDRHAWSKGTIRD